MYVHTHTHIYSLFNFLFIMPNSSDIKRFYSLEVVLYTTTDVVLDVISKFDKIQNYLLIYHNKDISAETGLPVKPHTHCYFTFTRALSVSYLSKYLEFYLPEDVTCNTNQIQFIKGTLQDCYSYALHLFDPDKYPYEASELFSNNIRLFKHTSSDETNKAYKILMDFEQKLSLRQMAQKWGRDFIIHYSAYHDFYELMKFQEHGTPDNDDNLPF